MPDPAWPSSPPEINHLRLVGAGAGGVASTVANGTAWQAVTASSEATCSVSVANTACTAPGFDGVGGAASAARATGLNDALHLLAAWAQEKTGIASAAVSSYQTAVASMIPAAVSIANRTEQAADTAINPSVFGALTPAIIALDTTYFGEYWPHNAAVGTAYGAALATLTGALAIPPPLPATASPTTGSVTAAESAAQAAASEAAKESGRLTNRTGMSPEETAQVLRPLSGLVTQIGSFGGLPQQGTLQMPAQALSTVAGAARLIPRARVDDPVEGLDEEFATPTADIPMPAAAMPSASVPTVVGQAGASVTASSGPGLAATTYARPATAFPAESGGRPVGLKGGEPVSTRQQGPASAGFGVAQTPLVVRDRSQSDKTGVTHARVLLSTQPSSDERI